jgi:thiamine-phosphate diphosphorylase
MRPLPRVHAYTDGALLSHPELGIRAAAIAAGGAAVALHARARGASAAHLTAIAARLLTLARPAEAAVFVSGRADIAAAVGAQGVQLARDDLAPSEVRRMLPHGWIGCSVHDLDEAAAAVREGANFLVVGTVYPSASHPGRQPVGLGLVREAVGLGVPVIAIGGITPERVGEIQATGAYGVAAIRALWYAPDPAAATLAMLQPWAGDS